MSPCTHPTCSRGDIYALGDQGKPGGEASKVNSKKANQCNGQTEVFVGASPLAVGGGLVVAGCVSAVRR